MDKTYLVDHTFRLLQKQYNENFRLNMATFSPNLIYDQMRMAYTKNVLNFQTYCISSTSIKQMNTNK